MPESLITLIHRARSQLNVHTNASLARFLGISRRTVQRHTSIGGIPDSIRQDILLKALHPKDPTLAKTLARVWQRDLAALGIVQTPAAPIAGPAPAPGPSRPAPSLEHAEAVILAASDALGMLPRDVRPALAKIFKRVRSLGVDLDRLTALLAESAAQAKQ
jgi:hypothetical protein